MAQDAHPTPISLTDDEVAVARNAWLSAMADGEPARDVAALFGAHEALRRSRDRQVAGRLLASLIRA